MKPYQRISRFTASDSVTSGFAGYWRRWNLTAQIIITTIAQPKSPATTVAPMVTVDAP